MNTFNNNYNNFEPENNFMHSYNPSRSPNLMKYVRNINNLNKEYTREKGINDIGNKNYDTKDDKNKLLEDEEIIPERSLSNYVNNKFLSDAILKLNDNEFYIHKIILCSCSDYINNQINSNSIPKEKENNEKNNENENNKDKIIINFPEIIPSSFGGGNRINCIEKVLKYCYNNQVFKSIESDINQYNIFTLLELSHCLGIKSLKLNLEKKIINNFIQKDNATKLALDSKIFDLQKLNKESINFIVKNFKEVKIFKNDIIDLDFDTFKQIITSEEINIDNEKEISDCVIDYIKSRRELPEEKEEKKEKGEKKENNNEEEKKEEEKKEEKKEEEKKNDEEKEKEKDKNENDVYEKWKKYLNDLKDSVKKKKLSKDQEKELIACIKFDNLSHSELLRLTNEPIMNEYKDLLLKSLSSKLQSYEEGQNNDNNRPPNMNQRFYSQNQDRDNNNINENPNFYYSRNNYDNRNNFDILKNKSIPNPKYSNFPKKENMYNNNLTNDEYYDDFDNNYNKKSEYYSSPIKNDNRFSRSQKIFNNNDFNNQNYYNQNNEFLNNREFYNIKRNNINDENEFEDYYNDKEEHLLNSQFFNINNKREKEKINRYRQMIKSEDFKKPNLLEQSSLSSSNNQLIAPLNYNLKFKYKYDFDRNGALYYLGTYGLSRKYQNPHDLKLIKAFGSSLLSGYYSDFVGRNIINLCSENEENSFFGVDLGPNRYLLPTLYSIRNRDSNSNVLLNWDLQGSNDKINFTILDKRRFNVENDSKNKDKYRKYRNLLKEPKTTSTWGISKRIREKYPNGFRYFLLKQIGKNSSGNYNLAISGFEIYGEGIGNGWFFS